MTFPNGSNNNKAGLIFCHDGNNSYYAVVLDRDTDTLSLEQISSGSWSTLDSEAATINTSTALVLLL